MLLNIYISNIPNPNLTTTAPILEPPKQNASVGFHINLRPQRVDMMFFSVAAVSPWESKGPTNPMTPLPFWEIAIGGLYQMYITIHPTPSLTHSWILRHESQLVALLSSLGFPAAPPLSTLHTMCFPWWINKGWQRINSKQGCGR